MGKLMSYDMTDPLAQEIVKTFVELSETAIKEVKEGASIPENMDLGLIKERGLGVQLGAFVALMQGCLSHFEKAGVPATDMALAIGDAVGQFMEPVPPTDAVDDD
jgi:hypothetical protein